ncbi:MULTISPECIES: class I SAM-dependent methyltransferase [Methylobacterium]|jgi:SAM-dependent methyltransferase|uniref:Methyltransferase domain-containing protein n=1 Tax=Methylobacterium longum TaxID=767694 RepID=A0ABT8AYL4_9HYPH|nr:MULTISPECIES: class I SAM-dependent methyltransferase [Methylobacterium]MCJ2097568.1 methyltransferase domain-containing protein [Methylobacterium sp. E-046]MDN3574845.1 methyltransferase domain-containing protein [Methylobacterium longum]GJE13885.1 Ubiquinone biosynthesis O-methyltransferase, mitochondrial [Methylobacterium longum]
MSRVVGSRVSLDYEAIERFFRDRGAVANRQCDYSATMYQDRSPDLVTARDRHEKSAVLPLIGHGAGLRVLDIGCGVGRWADAFVGQAAAYLGIDFSEELIQIARRRVPERPDFAFQRGAAQDLATAELAIAPPFDVFLIAGVFAYLNDDDVLACLRALPPLAAATATVCIREPVGIEARLSLIGEFSEELDCNYSAVYRTVPEYAELIDRGLSCGFTLTKQQRLLPSSLENRRETTQHVFLVTRSEKR